MQYPPQVANNTLLSMLFLNEKKKKRNDVDGVCFPHETFHRKSVVASSYVELRTNL